MIREAVERNVSGERRHARVEVVRGVDIQVMHAPRAIRAAQCMDLPIRAHDFNGDLLPALARGVKEPKSEDLLPIRLARPINS